MRGGLFALLMLLSVSTNAAAANADDGAKQIVERYRQVALANNPDWGLERLNATNRAVIQSWITSIGSDGTWADIDYENRDPASWNASRHLDRTRILARCLVDRNDPLHNDLKLEAATFRALEFWLGKRFQNPNWWWNRIGVPGIMGDVIVLLGDRLEGKNRTAALQVFAQAGRPKSGQGANTIWVADLALQYGALTGNAELIGLCSGMLAGEIRITIEDGIQPDYSFHQHYARLQQFSYGRPYLTTSVRMAWQLEGTPWSLPREKIQLLADFVLNGNQWMCRGIYTVPSALDRSVSRVGTLKWADIRGTLAQLIDLAPERERELKRFLVRQNGKGEPLVGARTFPRSDFTVFHRTGFSFFLKTLSDRTFATEVGLNNEHLKGALQNCGDHYLMRDGREYFDLAPVWNWNLLPGLTFLEEMGVPLRQPFVGAATDGTSSASAMDFRFGTTNETRLSAKKFWACHGDTMIVLIGGLTAGGDQPVRTALDQCLLRSEVLVSSDGGEPHGVSGDRMNQTVKWLHHAGFAYAPIGDVKLSVHSGEVSGTWKAINAALSDVLVTRPVFMPVLEHGSGPALQNSGFVIASGNPDQARKLFDDPPWIVLRNDAETQAVMFKDGVIMAVFYQPGRIVLAGNTLLETDKPCVILLRRGWFWVADPTHTGGEVNLHFEGKNLKVDLPNDGTTISNRR